MKSLKIKGEFCLSMIIFGTLGLFARSVQFSSSFISMCRGFLGAAFLIFVLLISKRKIDLCAIKKNIVFLSLSGVALGFNWIFLFESYKYTTIATATLCYYMAPIFILLFSVVILKEKLNIKKLLCIFFAFIGMLLISGVFSGRKISFLGYKGVLLGLCSAVFYAVLVLLNKKTTEISLMERTLTQLLVSAVVMLIYSAVSGGLTGVNLTGKGIIILLILGLLHTGVAYLLYFDSVEKLSAGNIAILSYVDPVVAIFVSYFVLREPCDIFGVIGAVLIVLSSAVA